MELESMGAEVLTAQKKIELLHPPSTDPTTTASSSNPHTPVRLKTRRRSLSTPATSSNPPPSLHPTPLSRFADTHTQLSSVLTTLLSSIATLHSNHHATRSFHDKLSHELTIKHHLADEIIRQQSELDARTATLHEMEDNVKALAADAQSKLTKITASEQEIRLELSAIDSSAHEVADKSTVLQHRITQHEKFEERVKAMKEEAQANLHKAQEMQVRSHEPLETRYVFASKEIAFCRVSLANSARYFTTRSQTARSVTTRPQWAHFGATRVFWCSSLANTPSMGGSRVKRPPQKALFAPLFTPPSSFVHTCVWCILPPCSHIVCRTRL